MPDPALDPEALRALARALRPLAARAGAHEPRAPSDPDRERPAAAVLAPELAARALERLERDLLPRTAGAHSHLVVGIVGPNNAGKSALFNALVGAGALSPSRAIGGATRRLVGALHPRLRAHLEAEPTLQRFAMRGVTPGPDGVLEALAEGADPAELLLLEVDTLPEELLLVDTPDFDSVLRRNREVAAALLQVADVALAVVTRHTYQNRDVVDFLREWLAHGRPWALVYNEAFDDESVTLRHVAVLAATVGTPPVAVFSASHSAAVARGEAPLEPRALAAELAGNTQPAHAHAAPGVRLTDWLRTRGDANELKRDALAASLAALREELGALLALLDEERAQSALLLERPTALAAALGGDVARDTMPMAAFLAAFRRVLDRRPSAFQQRLRGGLRWTGDQLVSGSRWVRGKLGAAAPASNAAAPPTLASAEAAALAGRWTSFHEALVRQLRPARDAQRAVDPELAEALTSDLEAPAGVGLERARASVAAVDAAGAAELSAFEKVCEGLIERELDGLGHEWALQLGVDALHLLPAVAAGAVILHTGGLGADVAVAGGGALSAVLAERASRVLGSGVAREARARWAEQRGRALAEAALAALLPTTAPLLRRRSEAAARAQRDLTAALGAPSV